MARLTPSEKTTPSETAEETAERPAEPEPETAAPRTRKGASRPPTHKSSKSAGGSSRTTGTEPPRPGGDSAPTSSTKPRSTSSSRAASGAASDAASDVASGAATTRAQQSAPEAALTPAPKGAPNPAPKPAAKAPVGAAPGGPATDVTPDSSTGVAQSGAAQSAAATSGTGTGLTDVTAEGPGATGSAATTEVTAGESAVEATDAPTSEATDAPTSEAPGSTTGEATDAPTGEATDAPTREAPGSTTGEATDAETDEPTASTTRETSAASTRVSEPEIASDASAAAAGVDGDSAAPPSGTADALTGADQARRAAVVAAEVFCVVGTLVGVGVLGTRVEESSGGALAANATLIAPAGPAFSIWTPIYLGLLGYTIWQALPSNATRARTRATGWLAAASMVLNAVWLLVTQQGWIWVSVVVIALLAGVLGTLVARLTRERASSMWERVLVDITFGAYLGWVSVATAANVTAALVESGVDLGSVFNQVAAVLVLAVAAGIGVFLASRLGGRWPVAGAIAWGLGWIAVGRFTGEPGSVATGVAAAAAAAIVLAANARIRGNGVVYHGRHS